jgi:transglutaminase-like putative cysteine protease
MTGRRPQGLAADLALLVVALAAGLGTGRLTSAPGAARVVLPILTCVLAGHVAVSVVWRLGARRPRLGAQAGAGAAAGAVGLAALAGVVATALGACWTLLLSATAAGVPTPTTWRAMVAWFGEAGAVITSGPTPLAPTTGVVLCLALGSGLVAVLGRALWAWQESRGGRRPRPVLALVPALGLFGYTALLSSDRDRVAGTVTFLVGALAFLSCADRAVGAGAGDGAPDGAGIGRVPRLPVGALGAIGLAAVVVAATLAAGPALASMHVDAFPHAGGGGAGTGGTASAGTVALLDNLAAPTASDDKSLLFVARSPVPTYWQAATLSQFDGIEWVADEATLASSLPEPAGATFTATVDVAGLRTTLLPAPPGTQQVLGAGGIRVTPGGNVESTSFSAPGLRYAVVARIAPSAAAPSRAAPSRAAPSPAAAPGVGVPASLLVRYLNLPPVAPAVVALAHRIVSGSAGPAAEADALVRWFNSGRYRYTLEPPASSVGDPLAAFLFDTHAGFCQQFAGAFAVLARIDGLPTRVAVGFTTGGSATRGVYRVRGADAHTWPEVYLGPSVGWVSFEPTPGGSGAPPSVRQGHGAAPGIEPVRPPLNATGTTVPSLGSALANLVPGNGGRAVPIRRPGSDLPAALIWSLTALAGALALTLGRRRTRDRLRGTLERWWGPVARRRRARRGLAPSAEILESWRRTGIALERASLGRRASETPDEHAGRLGAASTGRRAGLGPVVGAAAIGPVVDEDYRALAALATKAVYGRHRCTEADAGRAIALEAELRAVLDDRPRPRQRAGV